MSDFSIVQGSQHTLTPSALAPDGTTAVAFPPGTVFAWAASDASLTFSDATAQSPEVTGAAALTGASITLTVTEPAAIGGFTHTKVHTVDVVAPPPPPTDTIGTVDFTIS